MSGTWAPSGEGAEVNILGLVSDSVRGGLQRHEQN